MEGNHFDQQAKILQEEEENVFPIFPASYLEKARVFNYESAIFHISKER